MGLSDIHTIIERDKSIYELAESREQQRAYIKHHPSQVANYKKRQPRLSSSLSRFSAVHTASKYVSAKYSHAVSYNHPWRPYLVK